MKKKNPNVSILFYDDRGQDLEMVLLNFEQTPNH
jgi:hypothetical protein